MRRRSLKFVVLAIVATASLAVWASISMAGDTVGAFEIDGNTLDSPAGGAIDWSTPPPNLTQFDDLPGGGADTQFGGGAKFDDPTTWSCNTGNVQDKSDIVSGAISFREINGQQFAYVNFTRVASNGSANIDYEFNQGTTPNAGCPALPDRTVGDIIISFEQVGNSLPVAVVSQWNGSGFTNLAVGTKGVTWDAQPSANGLFGEAAINVTAILGRSIACGDFASVHMASRSSAWPQFNASAGPHGDAIPQLRQLPGLHAEEGSPHPALRHVCRERDRESQRHRRVQVQLHQHRERPGEQRGRHRRRPGRHDLRRQQRHRRLLGVTPAPSPATSATLPEAGRRPGPSR